MKRAGIAVAAALLLLFAGLFGAVLYNGPRMKVQPNLRAFQSALPAEPPGALPVEPREDLAALLRTPGLLAGPVPVTKENLAQGRTYYRYYCLFCHGESGEGNGPVGESYLPKPADLRTAKTGRYTDRELLRAMLLGVGHEPVLERVVPQRHHRHLILYVRSLADGS